MRFVETLPFKNQYCLILVAPIIRSEEGLIDILRSQVFVAEATSKGYGRRDGTVGLWPADRLPVTCKSDIKNPSEL